MKLKSESALKLLLTVVITFDDREVVLKMEDNKIIIEKINKEKENGTGEQEYNDK